jgi:hypothetical protein
MKLMKTNHVRYLPLIALLSGLALQCAHETDTPDDGAFDIYLVRDTRFCPARIDSVSIKSIDLPAKPVATIDDIATYEINTSTSGLSLSHAIIFKSEMKTRFGDENCCFVVVVNGKRMYQGQYWAQFMSTVPPNVILHTYTSSEFHLLAMDEGADKINDPRIIQALTDADVDVVDVDLDSH